MDHFDIVLALARAALESKSPLAIHQVQRLRDALKAADAEKAAKLTRLLNAKDKKQNLAPLAIEEMRAAADATRALLPGEVLTRNTSLPRDKETSAPLVRVLFPDESKVIAPILAPTLAEAIEDLLHEWRRHDRLSRYGAAPHTRCLLYGAPGVGKTELARYIARQLDLPCVEVRLDGMISSFLGTTARNIGALFDFANRYRCLLFLDEFDALAKARDDLQELGEIKRVVNTLLQCMDAREGRGFTIAATNHEHLLDSAVWRRFDARIEVPRPGEDARASMLRRFFAPIKLSADMVLFLVWMTDGLSGAEIASLASAAKRYFALHTQAQAHELHHADLMNALRRHIVLNTKLFSAERVRVVDDRQALDAALIKVGFNQTQRADFLGVSQSTVSRGRKRSRRRSVGDVPDERV